MPDRINHSAPVRPDAHDAVAVIGAGLAGLACARTLLQAGLRPVVFDKGRGPGGRLSTRRADADGGGLQFDHGAQYLTARSPEFRDMMRHWREAGVAAEWAGRIVRLHADHLVEESGGERFVGTPGMNALVRDLASQLPDPVRWGVRVAPPARVGHGWRLAAEDGSALGDFARVVVAAPAPQAALLLAGAPDLAGRAASASMAPCWTVMAAFDRTVETGWDAAFVAGEGGQAGGTEARPLTWIARDSAKPGRAGPGRTGAGAPDCWVLQAGHGWSALHVGDDKQAVQDRLLSAFRDLTGHQGQPAHVSAHRWLYALPTGPLGCGALWDPDLGIGACGDWCVEARAEGAWLSGLELARMIRAAAGPAA